MTTLVLGCGRYDRTEPLLDDRVVVDGYELEARDLIGPDFWPYGIEKNRSSIETLLRYSHEQGLTPSRLSVGDIFPHFV